VSNERTMTAAELMAKLRSDPNYQSREVEKERLRQERQRAIERSFEPYLRELHSLGLCGNSLDSIVKLNCPLPDTAVDVLMSAIGKLTEPRLLESVVRAMGASENPFDGRPLRRCFESTDDEALKWAIANTIALTHPHSIDGWLSELRESHYWDTILRDLGLDA